jgi:hypothetical protein
VAVVGKEFKLQRPFPRHHRYCPLIASNAYPEDDWRWLDLRVADKALLLIVSPAIAAFFLPSAAQRLTKGCQMTPTHAVAYAD